MKKITLMNTDLELSPMGMGCVNAGIKWDGEDAYRIFDAFLDMGGNVYDTARVYSDWIPSEIGRSERVLGQWLRQSGKRHDVILLTKGGHPDMTSATPDMHASRISAKTCVQIWNFLFVHLAQIILIFIFITEIMKRFLQEN